MESVEDFFHVLNGDLEASPTCFGGLHGFAGRIHERRGFREKDEIRFGSKGGMPFALFVH